MRQNHLIALPLELHIHIFSNLQPYDILQIRQTCQALYLASSERTVWMDALHRICVENTLFEPSFPVESMSVLELQRASMGPCRWIARSSSGKRNSDRVLPHIATRHLLSAMSDLYIADDSLHAYYLVPGGRYLFSIFCGWLVLWDLGSPYSSGREPHSVAAVPVKFYGYYIVHSTPDGMGLRVFVLEDPVDSEVTSLYIYEIYPKSTSPQLTQIACTRIRGSHCESLYSLSYDRLIFAQGNILTVWDYKTNTWARWGVEGGYSQMLTTKSAVMLVRGDGVSVWEIPPLLPESSLSMSNPPSIMSPVFQLHYPGNCYYPNLHQVPCRWYSSTPQPLYYDMEEDLDLDFPYSPVNIYRFEVAINPKISGGTLKLLKTFEVLPIEHYRYFNNARICQSKSVSICANSRTGYLGTHMTDVYNRQLPPRFTPLCVWWHYSYVPRAEVTFCPATGRVVYRDTLSSSIIVLNF